MKYFEQMLDKYGFDDGIVEPREARHARAVYIRYLNAQLSRMESKHRVYAYDRPGAHNNCMIAYTTLDMIHHNEFGLGGACGAYESWIEYGTHHWLGISEDVAIADPRVNKAIDLAYDADLDSLVVVRISINHATLTKLCNAISNTPKEAAEQHGTTQGD